MAASHPSPPSTLPMDSASYAERRGGLGAICQLLPPCPGLVPSSHTPSPHPCSLVNSPPSTWAAEAPALPLSSRSFSLPSLHFVPVLSPGAFTVYNTPKSLIS